MHHTYKGIYLKFRGPGLIQDVLYENIVMFEPEQWPIWIGPAQQADNDNPCHPNPCSLCWPELPFAQCNVPAAGSYQNITLRNITISNSKNIGVIMANATNPMLNVVFDGVKFVNLSKDPSEYEYFKCENVANGVAIGDTWPVPSCFADNTDRPQMTKFLQ